MNTSDARFVVFPPVDPYVDLASVAAISRIADRLRAPDGCPWDREQTHASLRPHLLEEAYEALEALDSGDLGRLRDEPRTHGTGFGGTDAPMSAFPA